MIGEGAVVGARSRIGYNCNLGQNVFVDRCVVIENRMKSQKNLSLYNGVVLHDEVFAGPSAVFTNVINFKKFLLKGKQNLRLLLLNGVLPSVPMPLCCAACT